MNALCLCPDGIIPPVGTSPRQDPRPIRAETRVKLVAAIATGRQWLDQLVTGTIQNFEQIADARSAVFGRSIELLRSLFLRQASFRQPSRDDYPGGIGVARLRDLPTEWAGQYERLGLARPEPNL